MRDENGENERSANGAETTLLPPSSRYSYSIVCRPLRDVVIDHEVDAFDLFDNAVCHAAEQSRLEGFAVECRIAKGVADACDVLKADLDVDLLCDRQGVFDLDSEVSDGALQHGALQLGVAEQDLNRAYVACAAVDQRRLRAARRMCSVG
jgi:hypothetical protein